MLNFEETSRPDPVRVLPAYKEHPDLGRDGSIEAQVVGGLQTTSQARR